MPIPIEVCNAVTHKFCMVNKDYFQGRLLCMFTTRFCKSKLDMLSNEVAEGRLISATLAESQANHRRKIITYYYK